MDEINGFILCKDKLSKSTVLLLKNCVLISKREQIFIVIHYHWKEILNKNFEIQLLYIL